MSTYALGALVVLSANERRGRISMRKVHAVSIEQSIDQVCQRATVTLPRNVKQLQDGRLKDLIRRGDPIEVSLGYNGELNSEFSGYVTKVSTDVPVVLELHDGLWKVLQRPFSRSYRNAHLPTLIGDVLAGAMPHSAMDATIGPVRFEQGCTVATVLKTLKDEFGLVSFLKDGTLYCGQVFDRAARTVRYDSERNLKSNELKYRMAEDVKVKVTAKSVDSKGEKLEVELGDVDGEQRTLNYYGIATKAELRKLAEVDMKKFKFDGYEGAFTAWGLPFAQFGDRVSLRSALYPERDGEYLAEGVDVSFGPQGFERNIKLAQRWTS